jgi:GTP pyrophosphokinase
MPSQKIVASPLMAEVIREMGFRKGDDFYIALGAAKVSPQVVVNKVMQRLKAGETAETEPTAAADLMSTGRRRSRPTTSSNSFGIAVDGIDEVMLRLAKCCHPVPGDEIVGYISLGRGITIHRDDCPNVEVLRKDPERFTTVAWDGDAETSFQVEIEVQGWDRHRLLEDLSRTFAEAGINILEARCTVNLPMIRNQFVVEVGDTRTLDQAITRLRNIDNVFDAYRVTPGAGG